MVINGGTCRGVYQPDTRWVSISPRPPFPSQLIRLMELKRLSEWLDRLGWNRGDELWGRRGGNIGTFVGGIVVMFVHYRGYLRLTDLWLGSKVLVWYGYRWNLMAWERYWGVFAKICLGLGKNKEQKVNIIMIMSCLRGNIALRGIWLGIIGECKSWDCVNMIRTKLWIYGFFCKKKN